MLRNNWSFSRTNPTARCSPSPAGSGSYQLNRGPRVVVCPPTPGHCLDGLDGHPALVAQPEERLDICSIAGLGEQDEAVRQQHRVEVEAFEAAQVHAGDTQAVPGHADEPCQSLVPSPRQRLDRTTGAERHLPLVRLHEVVQLDEIDVVGAETAQGPLEAGPGTGSGSITRLRGDEELTARLAEPGSEPQLRVP